MFTKEWEGRKTHEFRRIGFRSSSTDGGAGRRKYVVIVYDPFCDLSVSVDVEAAFSLDGAGAGDQDVAAFRLRGQRAGRGIPSYGARPAPRGEWVGSRAWIASDRVARGGHTWFSLST